MILRKPYAFLIKKFKLIHIILSVLMIYTLYQTNQIRLFFNEYVTNLQSVVGTTLTDTYFNSLMFIFPLVVIILSIIIISLMRQKQKPVFNYIFNIMISILIIIMYSISHGTLTDMQAHIVDIRIVKLVRDFLTMLLLVQGVNTILTIVRATGFDIKKFNFSEDLAELEITDVDNEEFEFEVNLNVDKIQRKVNRRKRYLGYIYKENKLTIQIISSILITIVLFIFILNVTIYHRKYTQNVAFSTDEFVMNIQNAYITNKDNRGNNITKDKILVILDVNVRTLGNNNKTLNLSKMELVINNKAYYHKYIYRDKLLDIGKSYYSDVINKTPTNYLIVYEIPKSLINNKITFKYINNFSGKVGKVNIKSIDINLNLRNLDEVKKEVTYNIGETIDFKDSILKNSTLIINSSEIDNAFKLNYSVCTTECYNMVEYVKPSIYNNYQKAIIKLNSDLVLDETIHSNITDLFSLISTYGQINYTVLEENKVDNTLIKQVIPNKVKEIKVNYIESIREIKDASSVSIKFKVRDIVYNYIVK